MSYFCCATKAEAMELEREANRRKDRILAELRRYIKTDKELGITVTQVVHPATGWSVEADLTMDGESVKHYMSFDLLELELQNLMFGSLLRERGGPSQN